MTRYDDLDRALLAFFDFEAAAPAPDRLLENAMTTTQRHRPRPAWSARLHAGSVPTPRGETTRTLLIAAALVALLLAIVGVALVGGGRPTTPLLTDTRVAPSAPPASTAPIAGGPVDETFRATWIAETRSLPQLGTGAGPVSMTISPNGTAISAANFAPGAAFDSTISATGDSEVRLTLDRPSGGCETGEVGTYRAALSGDGSTLTLFGTDDCATRAEALVRTWGRSLADPTSIGAGFVATMDPPFQVTLPDQPLSARTLDDMIEIGGVDGFSLMAFRNPQGFVDACSTEEERVPYTPGAAAFADFLEQNPALVTLSREELKISGLPAIHIVTDVNRVDPPCAMPEGGLYLWTPKDCVCHFVGEHDSLYLVDLPSGDTMMFEVSPVDETNPIERQIIDTIRIPATVPSG